MITVSRLINGISVNGYEYLLDEDGKPLFFNSINEALLYLDGRNYTMPELLELDFEIEETANEIVCA
jgi:hypothetical protein